MVAGTGEDALRQLDDVMARLQRTMHVHSLTKQLGLTKTQLYILWYLAADGQAKASELARVVGLSPGAVTQVCDELVRMNLIARLRSESDRRVVYISLTEDGKVMLERVRALRSAGLKRIMSRLGANDVRELIRILNRVVDAFETLETDRQEDIN